MAAISKRGKAWFVQIRRKGYTPEYRTFSTKDAARRWARERESQIDRIEPSEGRANRTTLTLGDLIKRYVVEVTPRKQGRDAERLRLLKMLKAPMCAIALKDLTPAPLAAYRDHRAAQVKPGTVSREMSLLHAVVEVARRDWDVGIVGNVVAQVRRLPVKNARDRRIQPGEYARIVSALENTRNSVVRPSVLFAIETGLRRGELLSLTWSNIDRQRRTAYIPHSKTGYSRAIPLTDAALCILDALLPTSSVVFPITPTALRLSWNRVRDRAGVPDLRFHDLRHEAISRFAEMGLSTVELAVISGHRDMRMLMRYTHLRPADLAKKLAGRSWEAEFG